jgi:hypothetical protein
MLYGLVFVFSALMCAWQMKNEIAFWRHAATWAETPCWIENLDIQKVSHGKGGPTWESHVGYRYTFQGKEHRNSAISPRHLNHHRAPLPDGMHVQLQKHLAEGTAFRCFVNPASPDEAVLWRDLDAGELMFYAAFFIVFLLVGVPASFRGVHDMIRQDGNSSS